MRQILSALEYGRLVESWSTEELRPMAAVVAGAAWKMIERHNTRSIVFLCDDPLWRIGQLTGELLRQGKREVSLALLSRDVLPDLLDNVLICDMLFTPVSDESLSKKRQAWIDAMTASPCPAFSVTIPAGVDPDTGWAGATAVRSEITVVPGAYLRGLFLHDGLDHCGQIWSAGKETAKAEGLFRFEDADAKRLLPPRKRTAHKGDSGKALLCVGSSQYVGAALLSARACLAAGCGILFVACPNEVRSALHRLPEAIGVPVGMDWNAKTCEAAIRALQGMKAVGLGCGIGKGDVSSLIEQVLRTKLPLVLDADGLNCLSKNRDLFPLLHERVVLTPHPGEMGRLTGLTPEEVLDDPVKLASRYAGQWGCTVLLKGAATVVSDNRRACIVSEGNAGLGKGGSGDALTGIITGLLAQGIEPYDAACLGSYLLGTSADRAFARLRERMLRATHVIEALEEWNK